MKLADVKLNWVPSVSDDVVVVEVVLVDQVGAEVERVELTPDISSYVFRGLMEKSNYIATVSVSDGYSSASASVSVEVPDLESPQPVTNLSYEVVSVYDSE